jgi:ABC-type branched-subunit amino acid transport system ATPase component/ABC-type branched-subunit amino acid transport system permease subunit
MAYPTLDFTPGIRRLAAGTPSWLRQALAGAAVLLGAELTLGWGSTTSILGGVPFPNGVPFGNLVEGAVFGLLYSLPAFGLILVYRAQRVINFAQAALGGSGAVLGLLLITQLHAPYAVGLLAALTFSALLGGCTERFVLTPFASKSRLILTVATIGIGQILVVGEIALPSLFGGSVLGSSQLPTPFDSLHFSVGQVVLNGNYVAIVVVTALVVGALSLFFRLTRTGLAVRASAENADRARLLGIPVTRMATLVWILAGLLSAASAFLRVPVVGQVAGADIDPSLLLFPLAAAVIARFDNLSVALIAGMGLGVLDRSAYYATGNPNLPVALVLPVLLVALLKGGNLSRAHDTGVSSFQTTAETRPVPVALRSFPVVVWGGRAGRAGALLLAALAPFAVSGGRLGFLTLIVLTAMIALSLTVLTGWAGQVSLGQFGIAGIGAAVAGGLAARHHTDFFVTLAVAVLVGALVAIAIGIPALRLPGLFLAVVTLALAAVVERVVLDQRYFGWLLPRDGQSIERPVLFGRFDVTSDRAFYFVCLTALVLCMLSARRVRATRSGRVFISQRDNLRASQALGVVATRSKLAAFAMSGSVAALAGALYSYQVGALSPTTFALQRSIDVFVFAIVGGIASPYGAVLGAVFYETLQYFGTSIFGFLKYVGLGAVVPVADHVALAAGVLIVLAFFPGGLAAGGTAVRDRLLKRVAGRSGLPAGAAASELVAAEPGPRVAHADDPPEDAVLVCRGVDVGYDGIQVLFGVDLHVRRGEVLALLGTNGAGKSTLLRAVSGLSRASRGSIVLAGQDITHASPAERVAAGIVQVPGGRAVFPTITVADHFRAARWMVKGQQAKDRADSAQAQVLEWFPRLEERWDGLAGNLSGGEAQQLAVGMAFIAEPELLIIDELSLGLAPVIVEQLLEIVRLVNAKGTSIILVEQSVNVALTVADRAYFMEKGEVRYSGPTAELLERGDIMRSVFLEGAVARPAEPVEVDEPVTFAARSIVLEARGLSVAFGGVRAVNDVSFDLRQGEILGLIGPNGAGKTTIFDLVSGFLVPTPGSVHFQGNDVTRLGPAGRGQLGLGRSFQDARIFSSMTVAENIAVALERHLEVRDHLAAALCLPDVRVVEQHIAWTVSDLIDLLRLGDYRDSFVRELSTGSRRIVDLAMALAYDPVVLLLDEPSSGISQKEAESLGPLLLRIRTETGCGMLLIEHDMPLITSVSDRLLALELGAVVAIGTPDEVIHDPRVVASYLGSDEATINRSGQVPMPVPA